MDNADRPSPSIPSAAQLPRRYPTRVRISATRNFPNSCGKDTTEKARIERLEHEVVGKNNDKEIGNSTTPRKRTRKEEESKHEFEAKIDENKEDPSSKQFGQEEPDRKRVMEALNGFQEIYRKLVQEKESKPKEDVHGMRFDLMAFKLFKEKREDLNNENNGYLGAVPGVEVGDKFQFRVEVCMVGLHRQLQAGIDFIKQGERCLAISIVSSHSGRYNDDVDNSDVLVYSGAGMGNQDQRLEYGNLALKNSIDAQTPVRVIHGFKNAKKIVTYTYGGLYSVEKYWRKKDTKGRYVFMFQLRRMPGQPRIGFKEVKKSKQRRPRACSGLLTEDISQGKEKIPIRVVNSIDDEHPMPFEYTTKMIYCLKFSQTPPQGCDCVKGCSDSCKCPCSVENGGEIPFNSHGAIVEAKPLVYECGPSCKCPSTCHNRVSQHGIKFPLEVFKTESMGWGVRCITSIPSGSFVCEYIGEVIDDEEAQNRTNDEYLFAIGNNYYDESLWEGLSTSIPSLQKRDSSGQIVEDVGLTVDASIYSNVGRFINHSCTPNLYAQNVLYDDDDKRMPHIMLFASEDIPPFQELTYHYNYTIDEVHDSDGNIKKKNCYCGSIECTGRLY